MEQLKVPQTLENTGDFGIVDSVDNVDNASLLSAKTTKIGSCQKLNYPPKSDRSKPSKKVDNVNKSLTK